MIRERNGLAGDCLLRAHPDHGTAWGGEFLKKNYLHPSTETTPEPVPVAGSDCPSQIREPMTKPTDPAKGHAWQAGIWDDMSRLYAREIDQRFRPVIDLVVGKAQLKPGEAVLDLGSGTGAVSIQAAARVGTAGTVTGVDISPGMVVAARRIVTGLGLDRVMMTEGRAESLPLPDGTVDAVLASLSLMFVLDRAAAAREMARVLKPGGRLVAAVWGPPEQCDIVRFQQTAGRFAAMPPAPDAGPGSVADPTLFLRQLADAGITARVETETTGFDFDDFQTAWDVLAGVTASALPPDRRNEAMEAVKAGMWPGGTGPRHFSNLTLFIVGTRK